jgi:sugar O-acyltransferase (sialic acid O-acetyltransferase NeuD family)
MSTLDNLVILGAGGYARQLYHVVMRIKKYNVLGFCDETLPPGETKSYEGMSVFRELDQFNPSSDHWKLVSAVGEGRVRKRWYDELGSRYPFCSIVDPTCIIAADAAIGSNVCILGQSICSSGCNIGNNVIINWQVLVSHDVMVGENTSIASSVNLTGACQIGRNCEIGTGATVLPKIRVGENVTIGAGAVVTKDLPSNCTAVGIPAKIIDQH